MNGLCAYDAVRNPNRRVLHPQEDVSRAGSVGSRRLRGSGRFSAGSEGHSAQRNGVFSAVGRRDDPAPASGP